MKQEVSNIMVVDNDINLTFSNLQSDRERLMITIFVKQQKEYYTSIQKKFF